MANDIALRGDVLARLEPIGLGRILTAMMPTAVAAALEWQHSPVAGSDGQFERLEVRGLSVRPGVSREDLALALDVARQACRPAGPADAYAAVVPLVRLAAKRAEGDLDAALRREVWARELAEFPADAIAEAARGFMRRTHFLPHISELIAAIESITTPRRRLLRALERAVTDADAGPELSGRQISGPEPPSRAERLRDVIRFHTARGERHRAAWAEREFAKLEGRAPAEWATRPKPPTPRPTPTRMDIELAELAEQRRRRLTEEP